MRGIYYSPVCLSVTSRSSIETAEQIGLIFGKGVPFDLSHTVLEGLIQIPSRTFLQTLDLENFATAYRSTKRVINLAPERWTRTA